MGVLSGCKPRPEVLKRDLEAEIFAAHFCGYRKFGQNPIVEAQRAAEAGPLPRILKMATKDAAEHVGAGALGTIPPGQLADLIVVDGDPTTSISALRKVSMVIRNGDAVVDQPGRR